MLRLTLAQMRRNLGRLSAAGIAVVLGTAFVAATLLAGTVLTSTTTDAVTASFADADLVLTQGDLSSEVVRAVADVPGVASVDRQLQTYAEVNGPGGRLLSAVKAPASDPRLEPETLAAGRMPEADDEIALPETLAGTIAAGVGAPVEIRLEQWTEEGATSRTERLTVVGLLDQGTSAFLGTGGVLVVTAPTLTDWVAYQNPDAPEGAAWTALVALDDGAQPTEVQAAVALVVADWGVTVRTLDEAADALVAELTGSTQVLTALVLAFAAVALLVAGLVITNTLQVLVAQRVRTLALLRCVGADRAQLRRSVIVEALLLGLVASFVGVLLGSVLVQVVLWVLGSSMPDVPLPATISLTPAVVLVPLLAGTLVTLLAGLAPARAATRVAPLAALRPVETPVARRAGWVRAGVSIAMVVLGGAALAGGMVIARDVDLGAGLALGILGGATSFIGVVLAAVLWVPALMGLAGRALTRSGPAARLAVANGVRNPRRTAATSAALLIGVTLVTMMATGAASARVALGGSLDEQFPVDLAVATAGFEEAEVPAEIRAALPDVGGIAATAEIRRGLVLAGEAQASLQALGLDATAGEVLRDPTVWEALQDGTAVLGWAAAGQAGVADGDVLALRLTEDGPAVELPVVVSDGAPTDQVLLTRETFEQVVPDAPVAEVWLSLEDLDRAVEVSAAVNRIVSEAEVGLATSGAAVERAFFQDVVDTLLAVVVGLLGVAVVIAMVGVANTLSLSVLERRRESATLRAVGMTRGQLRGSLAVEGVLISLVGAVVGAALGVVYGWVGARTLLGEISDVGLQVPWGHLALVLGVALVAGLLASVLPARSAVRTPPVVALAVE